MIVQDISRIAEEASVRYLNVIYGFRGAYAKALESPDPFQPGVASDMHSAIYNIARTYADQERAIIEESDIPFRARSDALGALFGEKTPRDADDIPDALSAHLNALSDYLHTEILIQLERDITTINRRFRSMLLQASLHAASSGSKRQNSLIYLRAKEKGDPKFYFVDRINRRWPSQKYIRSIWRHHLLTAYNETYLFTLAEYGETTARVVHLDPNHRVHGLVLAIADEGNLPRYEDVRDEIFHPNADAIVTAYISQS